MRGRVRRTNAIRGDLRFLLPQIRRLALIPFDLEPSWFPKPTVRAAVGHILLGLFSFRNTEQPSAAQARRSHVDSEDTSHLGNSGDADGLGDNSNPSLYFALPSFGVFSGGVTNACSGVGLNAEACSRIFDCYLLFRSGGLYQPASWRCPKLDVVQREIGSDRLFQLLVPLFRGENGRPSRRISEGHDSQLQLENDRSPDLPQLRTSTKRSRRLRRQRESTEKSWPSSGYHRMDASSLMTLSKSNRSKRGNRQLDFGARELTGYRTAI